MVVVNPWHRRSNTWSACAYAILADYIISCNVHSCGLQTTLLDDGHYFQVVVCEFMHVAVVQYMHVLRQLCQGFCTIVLNFMCVSVCLLLH